jgi:hypothetical protein
MGPSARQELDRSFPQTVIGYDQLVGARVVDDLSVDRIQI